MKTPEDAVHHIRKRYMRLRGEWLTGKGFPVSLDLGIPAEKEALLQPQGVRMWAEQWKRWNYSGKVEWADRCYRTLGVQSLPQKLSVETPEEAASICGASAEWERARTHFGKLSADFPEAAEILSSDFELLTRFSDDDIGRTSDVVKWFLDHPACGLYPRQIPIEGIDTKWLESRKGMVRNIVAAVRNISSPPDLYELTGMLRPPRTVRMRLTDPELSGHTGGISDIQSPIKELSRLDITPARVFIVENLETGIAFPALPRSAVFMGLGYGAADLSVLPWLQKADCFYWGDLDTHGFAILDRTRRSIPGLKSILMDRETLLTHRALWTDERSPARTETDCLNEAEKDTYFGLLENRWGQSVRLEQERIGWDWAMERIRKILS